MKKKIFLLMIMIIVIATIAVTVGVSAMTMRDELTYEIVDADGKTVTIKESDIKASLALSKQFLRNDIETLVAIVNGQKITAYDLNIVRTIQAFDELGKEYTEKELLDIIIKDYIVYSYTANKGYIYDQSDEIAEASISEPKDLSVSEMVTEFDIYASSSGLSKESYVDMEKRVNEKMMTYSKYLDLIVEPLLDDEMGLNDEESRKIYAEYETLTQVESIDEVDWDAVNACSAELVDIYTQKLIDEADVVIYEDRLN